MGAPEKCFDYARWDEVKTVPGAYRSHLRTSVTLPLSADILSIITEGARTHGSLDISQTADVESDSAVVEIDVFYRNKEDFDEATVCRLRTMGGNEWGLGIFVRIAMHRMLLSTVARAPTDWSLPLCRLPHGCRLRTTAHSIAFVSTFTFDCRPLLSSRSPGSRRTCTTSASTSMRSQAQSTSTSSH